MQKTSIQKSHKIAVGFDSITIDFLGSNRQVNWTEISLVYDKSDKHTATYDRYNVELAAKYVKSAKLSNFSEIYRLTKEKKYYVDNSNQKYLL